MGFFGRERELARIEREIKSDGQSAILVYGRRRVGKSELIKQSLSTTNCRSIYYECKETSEQNNLESLSALVSEVFGLPPLGFGNLEALLNHLFTLSIKEPLTLVLDEYPYLRKTVKGLDSILQSLLDRHRDSSHLTLILCGSFVEVMKSLLERENPLYGRINLTIDLKPMDYYDAARFYPDFSAEDKVRLYSVFGGIPYYTRLIDPDLSVRENIIELISEPGARLENEVSMYLNTEISKIVNVNEVFGTLADGYSRYRDILSQSHVSSGPTMVDVLDRLIRMELVQKQAPINDPLNKKKSSYRIIDGLSLFYYRYVFRYASQRTFLDPQVFYDRYISQDFETNYAPHAFEEVCRQFLIRKNRAGELPELFDDIGRYWYDDPANKTNGEFDVVTHDPHGYVFYEAKFRGAPVTQEMIDEEIEQVRSTGLDCYAYGFFSRSGFDGDVDPSKQLRLFSIEELYR